MNLDVPLSVGWGMQMLQRITGKGKDGKVGAASHASEAEEEGRAGPRKAEPAK